MFCTACFSVCFVFHGSNFCHCQSCPKFATLLHAVAPRNSYHAESITVRDSAAAPGLRKLRAGGCCHVSYGSRPLDLGRWMPWHCVTRTHPWFTQLSRLKLVPVTKFLPHPVPVSYYVTFDLDDIRWTSSSAKSLAGKMDTNAYYCDKIPKGQDILQIR